MYNLLVFRSLFDSFINYFIKLFIRYELLDVFNMLFLGMLGVNNKIFVLLFEFINVLN